MPSSNDKDQDRDSEIPRVRTEPRPDFSKPLPRKRLPAALQDTLDNEEKLWDTLYEGGGKESTDSNLRYAAYASRVRTILLAGQRYIAYTSDIGESFRPVAHPYLVRGAYGVSWAYLVGDVAHEGYKAYVNNQRILNPASAPDAAAATAALGDKVPAQGSQLVAPGFVPAIEDYRTVMVQRALFQGVASMGLPAFTIHSIVKYSGKALKDAKNARLRTWGPIGLGLSAVPALPYMFDKPVEHAVEWIFHKTFEIVGGPSAVGHTPETGRAEMVTQENERVNKEKEL